jgi:chemotaxis protein methyltransferase CheR
MKPENLRYFAELLHARTGIVVDEAKEYLIQTRLAPIAGTSGLADVDALIETLRRGADARLTESALDAMTTNETFFFRDQTPFDHLRRFLAEPSLGKDRPVRIWSAAASTGQEAYSIAMLCAELPHLSRAGAVEIVGTDISAQCLTKARAGLYSSFEIQRGLPVTKLMEHFTPAGDAWCAKPALRDMVSWRQHNLLDSPWALGRFDVVFCRNVLIYFDISTRKRILEHVGAQMAPGGVLYLGAAETTLGVTEAFSQVRGEGCWMKAQAPNWAPAAPMAVRAGGR